MSKSEQSAQHTPGPWSVSELDASGEKSEYYIFIEPAVAVIERKVGEQYDMADAHLLASAKDLFGLALRLEPWLAGHEAQEKARGEREHDSQFLLDLRAAIAKAGGAA